MGDKFKVRDIEGSKEDVISFIGQTGLDLSNYLNSEDKIKVPFWSIVLASALVLIFACCMLLVENPSLKGVFTLLFVALSFVNICLIYMSWKNRLLAGIVAFGELILFVLALNIYTPKDVVDKIENHVTQQESK